MKLFCVSDIHGFYDELIAALNNAGFERDNPGHLLICCGDYFDRGRQPRQVLDYLLGIQNKILIRGNHEDLLEELLQRQYPLSHDVDNGTLLTLFDLSGVEPYTSNYDEAAKITYELTKPFLDSTINYFETSKYVFVHAFVPMIEDENVLYAHGRIGLPAYKNNPSWRIAHAGDWSNARWYNPIRMIKHGYGIDKTIVAGHWHTSYGHAIDDGTPEFGENANYTPYKTDGLIAIDACTAASGFVNVVVLEDNL